MDVVDNKPIVQKESISGILPKINWSLDVTTHQFEYDTNVFSDIFKYNKPIHSVGDLLALITQDKQDKAYRIFKEVLLSGEEQYFTCCLNFKR